MKTTFGKIEKHDHRDIFSLSKILPNFENKDKTSQSLLTKNQNLSLKIQ